MAMHFEVCTFREHSNSAATCSNCSWKEVWARLRKTVSAYKELDQVYKMYDVLPYEKNPN